MCVGMFVWGCMREAKGTVYTRAWGMNASHEDMCIDMCIDMRTDICAGMCTDMCAGMRADMCVNKCTDMRTDSMRDKSQNGALGTMKAQSWWP